MSSFILPSSGEIDYLSSLDSFIEEQQKQDRINFLFYKPHPKHLEFHTLGKKAKERLFLAANRIGKTMCCSLEVCMHLTGYYPDWWTGHRYTRAITSWVGGVTGKEVYGILERRYFEGTPGEEPWIHPDLVLYRNKMEHVYHVAHKAGGYSVLRFKSYEQGREAWQGERLDVCHLDEKPPLDVYTEASMRLMSTSADHHGMMLVSATCLFMDDFVLTFIQRTEKKDTGEVIQIQNKEGEISNSRVFLMAGWDDAAHLTHEEKERMKVSISPHELEARSKGVPSIGSGMVYPISESVITCDPFEIPDHWSFVYGMDFGWKDPTAVIFAAIDRDKDRVYIYDEYAKSELTPQIHSVDLIRRGCDWMPGVYDPAGRISSQKDGSRLVDLYREAGLTNLTKAENSRELGVQTVFQLMQRGKLKIFNTMTQTLRELRMYARDEKGRIKDGNDHLLDALRYVVLSGIPLAISKYLVDEKQRLWEKYSLQGFEEGGLLV
jgi:phage terminase large subunit-like protein